MRMALEHAEIPSPPGALAFSEFSDGFTTNDARQLFRRSVIPFEPHRSTARLILLHGYGDHSGRYVHFMRWLAERGVACHSFDFRGHGRSPGRRGYVRRWDEYLEDLAAFLALAPLRADAPGGPLFVLGHRHGGLVAAAAGGRGILVNAGVAGCILTSPYLRGYARVSAPWHAIARACDWV